MHAALLLGLALTTGAQAAEIGDMEKVGIGLRAGGSVLTGGGGGLTAKFFTVPGGGFALHVGSRGAVGGRVPSLVASAQFERDGFPVADGPNLAGRLYSTGGITWWGQELGDPTYGFQTIGLTSGGGIDLRLRTMPLSIYGEAAFNYYLLMISGGSVGFVGNAIDIQAGAGVRYYF